MPNVYAYISVCVYKNDTCIYEKYSEYFPYIYWLNILHRLISEVLYTIHTT